MGQAKKRGSFEQRLIQAKSRNAALELELAQRFQPSHELHDFRRKKGIQRLATRMVSAGLLVIQK